MHGLKEQRIQRDRITNRTRFQPLPPQSATEVKKPIQKPYQTETLCILCKEKHDLTDCKKFQAKNLKEKNEIVYKEFLCWLGLKKGHFTYRCKNPATCKVPNCGKRHHELLHPDSSIKETPTNKGVNHPVPIDPKNCGRRATSNACLNASSRQMNVIGMAILPVKVRNKMNGRQTTTYAFLDNGSNTTFCTDSLAKELDVTGKEMTYTLTTMSNQDTILHGNLLCDLEISDLNMEHVIDIPATYSTAQDSSHHCGYPKSRRSSTLVTFTGLGNT